MASSKRKKKNLFTLLILCLSILLLVGAYYLVSNHNDKKAAEEEETTAAEDAATDTSADIFTLDSDSVVKVSFTNQNWQAAIVKNEDGTFTLEGDESFPLDQEKAQYVFDYIDGSATKTVTETPENLADYGLDDPQITATATDSNGAEYTIHIGDKTGSGVGYYAQVEGSDTVYVVAATLYTYYVYEENDLITMEETPSIDTTLITFLGITSPEYGDLALMYTDTPSTAYAGLAINNWLITDPFDYEVEADTDAVTEMLANYESFTLKSAVDYKEENLAEYGLENPETYLYIKYQVAASSDDAETTTYNDMTYTLYFGNTDEDGNYYVRQGDSSIVYLMAASDVETLLGVDAKSLVNTYINLINIKTLDQMQIEYAGTSHTYEMLYETVTNDDGVDELSDTGFIVDGTTLTDDSDFRSLYQVIIGAQIAGFLPEDAAIGTDPLLSITYDRNSEEYTDVTIDYLPYNDSYDAVSINGVARYYIDARDVTEMISAIDAYVPQ